MPQRLWCSPGWGGSQMQERAKGRVEWRANAKLRRLGLLNQIFDDSKSDSNEFEQQWEFNSKFDKEFEFSLREDVNFWLKLTDFWLNQPIFD